MARIIAALALFFAGASAFAPSIMRNQNRVVMAAEGRREMLAKTAGAFGLIAGAGSAVADGAVSAATVARARGIYGGRILALEDAVAKGNLAAVADEKNAFTLFVSGVYAAKGEKIAATKAKAKAASDTLFAAVEKGDTSGAKAAYKDFLSVADIAKPYTGKDLAYSQGYSTEYDWKYKTPKGTIYVR